MIPFIQRIFSIFALTVVLLGSIAGCTKNPCDTAFCLNGSTCVDGSCECDTSYVGNLCETYCGDGYWGSDCNTQIEPDSIFIRYVAVHDFTFSQCNAGGTPYNPDIFIQIEQNNVNLFTSSKQTNVQENRTYRFTDDTDSIIPIAPPYDDITLKLIGDCQGDTTLIFETLFPLYTSNNKFPPVVSNSENSRMAVNYFWHYANN